MDDFRHKHEDAATTIVVKKRKPELNARESSLLQLLNQGKSIPEIADELDFVDGTVKDKLSALYRKLGVRNRASTVEKSRTLGLRDG